MKTEYAMGRVFEIYENNEEQVKDILGIKEGAGMDEWMEKIQEQQESMNYSCDQLKFWLADLLSCLVYDHEIANKIDEIKTEDSFFDLLASELLSEASDRGII